MFGKLLLIAALAIAQGTAESAESAESYNFIKDGRCPEAETHYLLPHEWDCTKFYYCEYGYKRIDDRVCAEGTYFSYELQVCVHPIIANCNLPNVPPEETITTEELPTTTNEASTTTLAPTTTTTQAPTTTTPEPTTQPPIVEGWLPNGCPVDYRVEQLFPHETETNLYYQCTHGEMVLKQCAAGTHFNFEEQICDNENGNGDNENGNGDNENGNGDNENGNGDNENGNGDNENGNDSATTTQAPATTTTQQPTTEAPIVEGSLPNGCPVDYRVEQLFPHETESNLYYQCTHGELVLKQCAAGTHFNFEEQICDNENGNGDNENGNGDNENGNGDNENGNGDNENGNDSITATQAPATTTTQQPTTEAPIVEGSLPNGCPVDYRVEQLFPHETESNLYYQCTHGELVLKQCAAGTHFNFEEQICELYDDNEGENGDNGSENGDNGSGNGDTGSGNGDNGSGNGDNESDNESGNEDNGSGNTDNGSTNDNGCPSDHTQELLLPHTDCGKFYQCTHGVKVEMRCPNDLHFSVESQACELPSVAGCGSGDGDSDDGHNENGDNGNGNTCATGCNVAPWAHETDCDKYWWCDGETSILSSCSEGLHFNANTRTCDFICNAGCARNNIQATVSYHGVNVFLPWDKIDDNLAADLSKYIDNRF